AEALVTSLIYRLAVLAVGFGGMWLGYKLFRAGVFDKAAEELTVKFGQNQAVLRAATPGAVFAMFGMLVIAISLIFPPHNTRDKDGQMVSSVLEIRRGPSNSK